MFLSQCIGIGGHPHCHMHGAYHKNKTGKLKKRNYFISYHHNSDLVYLQELRKKFTNRTFADYGFKDENLAESSKRFISDKIQYRLWSSSVTILLIGEKTGDSTWIDWEIWYSLQKLKDSNISRRSYKPKGLLALYLPVKRHNVPPRFQANLDSGYAEKIYWEQLDTLLDTKLDQAYRNRAKTHLIVNDIPLKDNPRKLFSRLNFKGLFGM